MIDPPHHDAQPPSMCGERDVGPVDAAPVDVPMDAAPVDVPVDAAPVDVPMDAAPVDVPVDAPPVDVPMDAAALRDQATLLRMPRARKPATIRDLGPVDASTLRDQAARLPDRLWGIEDGFKSNRYFCFHHTQHIIFRFIPGNHDPRRFYSEPIWTVWQTWLLPVMRRAVEPYGFVDPVYPKAMLARLMAGHGIDVHTDGKGDNGSHPLVHKVHVPLQTDPEAVMEIAGERFHLAPGRAWEINNLVGHGAFNGGRRDRIHLIFEVFDGAAVDSAPFDDAPAGEDLRDGR